MAISISTCISSHNEARLLPRCLDAILSQSVQPCEIVVLDDFSTDGTRDVIAEYAAKHPIIRPVLYPAKSDDWLRDKFLHCRELKGDWIDLGCADNYIDVGYYAECDKMIARYPHAVACFCASRWVTMEMRPFGTGGGDGEFLQRDNLSKIHNPGGAASLLRADAMRFLIDREVWRLQNWSDAVGYHVIAAMHGCIWMHGIFGGVNNSVVNDHGNRVRSDATVKQAMLEDARKFLSDPEIVNGVAPDVLDMLRNKVESWV